MELQKENSTQDNIIKLIDLGILKKYSLEEKDLDFILNVLGKYKTINVENLDDEILKEIGNYNGKGDKIIGFIKLFQNLEDNDPKNEFKLWISQNFPYFWKGILSNILGKLEINDEIRGFKDSILSTLDARDLQIDGGAKLYETGPENSNSIIINLPVFLSDKFGSLSDGAYLNDKDNKKVQTGFSSFGGGRSSYTRSLEKAIGSEANSSLVWYLDYPKSGKFDSEITLNSLVEKIKLSKKTDIHIHGASTGGKLALELVSKLANDGIKVNKLFINGGALKPESVQYKDILTGKTAKQFSWINEFNSKDKDYWEAVNQTKGVSIRQVISRLGYLKKGIDFKSLKSLLNDNVDEVIAINSIPFEGAKSDGMILTDFPDYLKEIFGDKVKDVIVPSIHYMVPNTPGVYAKELNKYSEKRTND
ncbi:MAG: hypothetical protein WC850_00045 [Candidatus Gracilibacteria bacterium]